jgi:spore germination protein YaaH
MPLSPWGLAAGVTAVGLSAAGLVAGPGVDDAGAHLAGVGRSRYASADVQVNPWGLGLQRGSRGRAVAELRFGSAPAVGAGPARPARVVSGWIPFWNYERGLASFRANPDVFSEVYGFFHEVDSAGRIHTYADGGQIRRLRAAARRAGVPLYGTILDAGQPRAMARLLADDQRRTRHVRQIVGLVDDLGYDGIDIDYEQFAFADGRHTWKRTRGNWVAFMSQLGAALHQRGKLLATATPTIYDGERTDRSGYWVYDWEGIAPHVDKVGVMTYDFSYESRGPTSPRGWFTRTADYAASVLGAKAGMGVPAFGYDWSRCAGRSSMTQAQALRRARSHGKRPSRANWAGEARFEYRHGRCRHVVWFGDPGTIGARAATAVDAGTGGIAIWALGNEHPATWRQIRAAVVD